MGKAVQAISEMRSLLWENGWGQKQFCNNKTGELCVLGALARTSIAQIEATDTYVAVMSASGVGTTIKEVVDAMQEVTHQFITVWNDDRHRTFSEVIDMLDKAEKVAAMKEEEHGS